MRASLTTADALGQRASKIIEAQEGFMLMEVVISAFLVGLIAVGTFSGFESAGRAGVDERSHAQATELAAQDEERLHGETTTELAELAKAGSESKTISYSGTTFTITSSAQYVSASKETFSCETTGGSANYVQTTSSVSWPALGTRPPVTQSSIVTNSAPGLLVKVFNQDHLPVSGALITVTGETTTTQTTGSSGCVFFLGLKAKTVEEKKVVEVAVTEAGYVDRAGNNPPLKSTVTLSPNSLTSEEFVIGEAGKIEATFVSEIGGVVKEVEAGDTFYAAQASISPSPKDFIGGAENAFAKKVTLENLFPFAKPEKPLYPAEPYTVYAGECEKNDPATAAGVALTKENEASVKPNETAKVKLEAPEVHVKVYEGTSATPKSLITESTSAKLINKECEGTSAQRYATGKVPYILKVKLKTGELEEKYRYQPYAKELQLCVEAKLASAKYYKATFTAIPNIKKAGTETKKYLTESGKEEKVEC